MSARPLLLALAMVPVLASLAEPAYGQRFPDPLPPEETPASAKLPEAYPPSYVFVNDLIAIAMVTQRVAIVDVASDEAALKAQVQVGYWGQLLSSSTRPELYAAGTYYSRVTRGERTDAITIYDKATLKPIDEIILPGGKRGLLVTHKDNFQFTNDEKWALVFNFTPASSITVVDLVARRVLSDVDVPGCTFAYPLGKRGFMSLCADGTMLSVSLDEKGKVLDSVSSKAFNDIDNDPMNMIPARHGGKAWFTTFDGNIRAIDLSGSVARDLGAFALPHEKTALGEWLPSGWQPISVDPSGLLYVLMNPAGGERTQKQGGTEIWVIDPITKQRIKRFPLANAAVSIEVTHEESPSLVAARESGSLDVYDAATGSLRRSIKDVVVDVTAITASQ
ncbi:amine dehydrogenase large subunit [Aquisediminimonas profunda]|uniref:amine dehydrogenase large subunit n=1 Tax=Aquisediminimonas profunda TaxID=1550733 RepID=UPI001C62D677|nr:amine dehydrogenase large subunit [Aquisediminimonas profunda]